MKGEKREGWYKDRGGKVLNVKIKGIFYCIWLCNSCSGTGFYAVSSAIKKHLLFIGFIYCIGYREVEGRSPRVCVSILRTISTPFPQYRGGHLS